MKRFITGVFSCAAMSLMIGLCVPVANAKVVKVTLTAMESDVVIDNRGTKYAAWTYDGMMPGKLVRATVGDQIDVTLINPKTNKKSHSIDFHAAEVDMLNEFGSVRPGHNRHFVFKAGRAGVYMYHCASNPLAEHIARGMFGVIIIDPKRFSKAYPKPDREYVLVQSQFFPDADNVVDMVENRGWTHALINGKPFNYDPIHDGNSTRALMSKPGERVRIFFVNANINMPVSFHPVAGIWDRVYVNGNPDNVLKNVQTYGVPVAGASTFDLVSPAGRSTNNALIDHTMSAAMRGASTLLINVPGADPGMGKGDKILIR